MLGRLARTCFRRRGRVVVIWLVAVFGLSAVAWGAVGPDFRTDFTLPDSETKEVFDFLKERSPADAGFNGQIVFSAPDVTAPEVRTAMEGLFQRVEEIPGVSVQSPYTPEGAFQISALRPNRIAYATLKLEGTELRPLQDKAARVEEIGAQVSVPGLSITYGGEVFYRFAMPASEALGILAAVVILLVAFGSVLAMGLPVATALAGLFAGLAGVALTSNLVSMPEFTPAMAAMIGLGVGIDYALFIVTRFREELHAGVEPEQATVDAMDTSGRAVLFAGATVIVSLFGLFLAGLGFVRGLAVACILAVLMMMVAAVTLLPALLGFAGRRIEVTTWRGALCLLLPVVLAIPAIIFEVGALALAGLVLSAGVLLASFFVPRLRERIPQRRAHSREQSFWYRWSRTVQRRPWPPLIGGLVVLVLLAVPLFSIRLGFSDTGNLAEKETARQAYDLLAEGFGPGSNGPLLVVLREPSGAQLDPGAVQELTSALGAAEGVVPGAAYPVPLGADAALIAVIPTGAPQDESTSTLVSRLRDDVIPSTGLDAWVGGAAAMNVDFATYLSDRLPIIVVSVLVLSFVLLMVVFRSLLVPLKAVVMNILSICAAYGVAVAIFQWGWMKDVIGIDHPGPIDAWVPMMLFAIVFGLSMDYEVFLLSRMREEYDRTGDNATAVADGLAVTARVITAAALIMFCVFASFVLGDDRQLKLFGLGLAVAVILDATVVRMVLVPATMELLGDRNWWLPAWLDRILPRVRIEGHTSLEAPPPDQRVDVPVGVGE